MEVLAAVVSEHNEPLQVQPVPLPELEEGAILGRVEAATLCATDVHVWHGDLGSKAGQSITPYIPGHETASVVVDVNGDRRDLLGEAIKPGDRVVVAYPFCGKCFFCTIAGQPTLCENSIRYGRERSDLFPYLLGGCAEYHYYPARAEVIRIPDEVSSPLAAASACAFRTIMHGFERLGDIRPHETVLVQGSGPLGLFATAVAREKGARRVLTIGGPESRLEVAKALGADQVLNIADASDAAQRTEWVLGETSGLGADVVIQCVSASAIPEGLNMVRRGGQYVSIGTGAEAVTIPGAIFTNKNLRLVSIRSGRAHHFHQALDFLATRKNDLPFDLFITAEYPLSQTTQALEDMASYKVVKPVILPTLA